ncbi:MAG: alginate export family protein [Pirellulales bacterium]
MPRPGNFPIPRTGCGYYSLLDQLMGTCRDKPPKSGYPPFALMAPGFFDADFRYVESLDYNERTLAEKLKRMHVTDGLTFSTGGQFWARYMDEHNSRLTETDNTYTLSHVRAYGDLMYGDRVRAYGEFIWADSFSEELAPLPIDVDLGDALNLFIELNLFDYQGHPVFARVGRQELLFGSQRLVTPLPWANTRRTFDGARLFRRGEQWDLDLFYSAFVPPKPTSFDQADDNQEFGGAWATYRPQKGHFVDFYYLYLDNTNNLTQQGIVRAPTEVHTIGTRYAGDKRGFLWDCELAMQFGEQGGQDLLAGAATAGVGRNFKDACWSPTFWLYYDYASGDSDPNAGDAHTFNQLFPFGHYYLGWIDLVGRQNIHDANVHLLFYPQPWMTVWLQYHHFWLNHSRDALYNAGGVAIRRDATGAAGTNVGDEIDIMLNFHLARNSDILVGYSRLFGGGFLENTSGPTAASDADLFSLMFQQKW